MEVTTAGRERSQRRGLRPRGNSRAPRTTTSPVVNMNHKMRAKDKLKAAKTERLAAEGKRARPSPPAPRMITSSAVSG